ncbi:MAG: YigZ family protein [Bacteroidales bacterium]|jgi:uncharacterized YigZ family protein|nr:YigZ family protein [Bacteroidales bacterium]
MITDGYRTLACETRGLYKEKGSKFIAVALPVSTEEEIRLARERIRKEFHDARHHCFAWRIGEPPYESRYNDDGEPSGTAGKPILGQIQSFELTQILIVVVRYFGGIKLGTGGLIQAYKKASMDALENGQIITKHWKVKVKISFDYLKMNEIMKIIKEEDLMVTGQESGERCHISLEINKYRSLTIYNKFNSVESLEWAVF